MIRLLVDKIRLTGLLPIVRNFPNQLRPLRDVKYRNISQEIPPIQGPGQILAKDIIVFKYDNPRFFKMMNFFAISQFFFWGYLGHWSFTSLRDAHVQEDQIDGDTSWYRKVNLGENKYKNTLASVCFIVGYCVLFITWTFTLRSVRYLIALKNGKEVALVTYTPFGKNRIMNVPIKNISAQESRQTAKVYLPLKIKGSRLFYILDMKGEFKNTRLYDTSIGLRRKF